MITTEASKCPECGYEPTKSDRISRGILRWISYLLILSIVGSIIGFPLLLLALYNDKKAKERKPTTYPA
jgi:hypothetical protein